MTTVSFWVAGIPIPQGSMKAFVVAGKARITSDNHRLKSWRNDVAAAAQAASHAGPTASPVRVRAAFTFQRPKGHFGSGRNALAVKASAPAYHTVKPDADKLARALLDAGTGILWRDDCQVVQLEVTKGYSHEQAVAGTFVIVEEVQA